jgi:hypothetical protein
VTLHFLLTRHLADLHGRVIPDSEFSGRYDVVRNGFVAWFDHSMDFAERGDEGHRTLRLG